VALYAARKTGSAVRDDTRNWVASAEYDLDTARDMLAAGRYSYVIFCCHLALEKMLKAHVAEVTQSEPRKTHSLVYLVRKAGVELPPQMREFLGELSDGSVRARYPGDLAEFLASLTREVAEGYLRSTEEAMKWLKEHPTLTE
jgi:HEPN domain-containing protein